MAGTDVESKRGIETDSMLNLIWPSGVRDRKPPIRDSSAAGVPAIAQQYECGFGFGRSLLKERIRAADSFIEANCAEATTNHHVRPPRPTNAQPDDLLLCLAAAKRASEFLPLFTTRPLEADSIF
jgi:hypothetical protein